MDPRDFAEVELEHWQVALKAQYEMEHGAEQARRAGRKAEFAKLSALAEKLRLRADLILAEAVSLKCAYRESLWSKLHPPF